MKILIVGANGLLGTGAVAALAEGNEIIKASRSGEVSVDLRDPNSIAAMYEQVGKVDAVIAATGVVPFKSITDLTLADYHAGIDDKVLGQVELVRQGLNYVTDGGSFTLTTGITERAPILTGVVASLANGALESFVLAAAIEMPRGLRINAVSPSVLVEAPGYHEYFPGFEQVTLKACGKAYAKSVNGKKSGHTYKVG
ncbi:MAG: short chain dehydrogenase [Actinobacteria bacterium]|jgi:NAD(P)-dependent dehydrogenase (short-subunit alcohol dehydrogenase family)|nr:short chain dehydrogenase [Actinomycetota bacterium]